MLTIAGGIVLGVILLFCLPFILTLIPCVIAGAFAFGVAVWAVIAMGMEGPAVLAVPVIVGLAAMGWCWSALYGD